MKRFVIILSFVGVLFFLQSCEKGLLFEFYPIEFNIYVQNSKGEDLLNPETEGSIAGLSTQAIFQGKVYNKDEEVERTKAFLAILYGLQTKIDSTGTYYLYFGQLDGADRFRNETITLDWGDGTADVIMFSNSVKSNALSKYPDINRSFYLNGKKNDGTTFIITK